MVSIAMVSQYLEGVDFPASRQEVIDCAEDRNAPPDVIEGLESMPEPRDGRYYSMAAVWDAIGELEQI